MKKICLVFAVLVVRGGDVFGQAYSQIDWVSPNKAQAGETIRITFATKHFWFYDWDEIVFKQGNDSIFWTDGLSSATSNGDTLVDYVTIPKGISGTFDIELDKNWTLWRYNRRYAFMNKAFTVTDSKLKVTPDTAYIGQTIKIDIRGNKTHFTNKGKNPKVWLSMNNTLLNGGYDRSVIYKSILNPSSISVTNDSVMSVSVFIPDTIPHGSGWWTFSSFDLYVEDSIDGIITDYQSLNVRGKLNGFSPNIGQKGKRVNLVVTGIPGSFDTSYSIYSNLKDIHAYCYVGFYGFSQGTNTAIYADTVINNNSDTLLASIFIPDSLDGGLYGLYVYVGRYGKGAFKLNGSVGNKREEYYELPNAFTIIGNRANMFFKEAVCRSDLVLFSDSSTCDSCGTINKWKWDFGDGTTDTLQNPTHTYAKDGIYKVKLFVQSSGGCDDTTTKIITVISINDSIILTGKTLTTKDSNATYQWYNCKTNSILSGDTNQSFTAKTSGDYAVILSKNGCVDTSACVSVVVTGVGELKITNYELRIYPNPADNTLNIAFNRQLKGKCTYEITDMLGRICLNGEGKFQPNISVPISSLPDGVYSIQIQNNSFGGIGRFVVRH